MSKYKSHGILKAFQNAKRGIFIALKSERNIRIHSVIAILVLVAGYYLDFNAIKFCILILTIALVIISEMINSGIEYCIDSVFHNKYSKLAGMAKDISAGAVMLSAFVSILVGAILFGESLFVHYENLIILPPHVQF